MSERLGERPLLQSERPILHDRNRAEPEASRAEQEAGYEQRPFEAPAAPDEVQAVDLPLENVRRLLPSKAVQDLHKLTQLPPAEWCTICVRSRARDDCHHRQSEVERQSLPVDEFPVVQADHTTLGDQTVLSILYTGIRGGAATVVMSKSAEDYVVSWFLARLTEWGCTTPKLRVQKDNPTKAIVKRAKGGP